MISICADNVVFSSKPLDPARTLYILLIRRGGEPFKDHWALPGGFVNDDEDLIVAASRELYEETGLVAKPSAALNEWSQIDRDPRGRVIAFPFISVVHGCPEVEGADDAAEARWFTISEVDELQIAFDHKEMISEAVASLAEMALDHTIGTM